MSKRRFWTKEEDTRLRQLQEAGVSPVLIAKDLGRVPSSVYNRACYLRERTPVYPHAGDNGAGGNGNGEVSDLLRSLEDAPVVVDTDALRGSRLVFTKDQLRLAMQLVVSVGDVDRSITLLQRLSELAV